MVVVFLMFGVSAQARDFYQVCLGGHYEHGRMAMGHAFINIEKNGEIETSYGYWPTEFTERSLEINGKGDRPLSPERRNLYLQFGSTYTDEGFREFRICQPIQASNVALLKADAESYFDRFGPWSAVANNCVKFATYLYNRYTNDFIPTLIGSPYYLAESINATQSAGFSTYLDYYNATSQLPVDPHQEQPSAGEFQMAGAIQ